MKLFKRRKESESPTETGSSRPLAGKTELSAAQVRYLYPSVVGRTGDVWFKVLNENMRPSIQGTPAYEVGRWTAPVENAVRCRTGYHLTRLPGRWTGRGEPAMNRVWIAEGRSGHDYLDGDGEKAVFNTVRVLCDVTEEHKKFLEEKSRIEAGQREALLPHIAARDKANAATNAKFNAAAERVKQLYSERVEKFLADIRSSTATWEDVNAVENEVGLDEAVNKIERMRKTELQQNEMELASHQRFVGAVVESTTATAESNFEYACKKRRDEYLASEPKERK